MVLNEPEKLKELRKNDGESVLPDGTCGLKRNGILLHFLDRVGEE